MTAKKEPREIPFVITRPYHTPNSVIVWAETEILAKSAVNKKFGFATGVTSKKLLKTAHNFKIII